MAVRDQSQKNQNSSNDGYFGTQLPAAFNDSGDDTANAGDQSTAAQQGGDDSAAASTEGQESAPAGGFGTIAAPPMEMAARAAADHAAAAAVQPPVVPRSLTRTYRSNGQNLGALQDAIRTKRASPGGAKGKVIAEVRDLHSDSKMPPGRKSTWNLQIHPRRVVGQLSSLIADLPEADVPASEAVDAVTRKDDAAAEIEVLKRIGQGAMGEIYEAVQTSLNRNLVIKTLKSDAVRTEYEQAMFVSEAVVTANLAHPNIVPIHDLGQTHDGRLFYSMKHVTGSPWSETLRALTVEENLDIFNKVCDAVAYAHSRGVVNRDLKPENVMIGEFGEVIVLDWGIAITTDEFEKKRSVLIDYQGGAGTPVYMAPEMVSADIEDIGTHSDIYLLGAVLYEALEGQPPHLVKAVWDQPPELQPSVVYRAVAQNEIEPPVKHKGELMRIALKAMSTDPADRFSSVERMQDAIREYRITGRAEERMRSCEVNKPQEYDDYQAAVALFTEALQNWPNNRRALEGNERSRIQYATLALKKQDYDLGLQIVADHEISAFKPLRKKLRKARMARRIMRWSFSSLVVLCCASFIYLFIVKSEASQAISAREIAQADTQTALAQREEAEQQKESLEKEKLLLEEEKKRTEASLKLEIARAEQAVLEKQSQLDDQESKLATATSDLEQKASELQEARENLVAAQNQQKEAKAALEATSGELQLAEEKLREAEKNAYVVEYRGVIDQIQVGLNLARYADVEAVAQTALRDFEDNEYFTQSHKRQLQRALESAQRNQRRISARPKQSRVSQSGNTVVMVSGQRDEQLRIWHRDGSGQFQNVLQQQLVRGDRVRDLVISQDGELVCVVGEESRKLWRIDDGVARPLSIVGDAAALSCVKGLLSPQGDRLYLIGDDAQGTVSVYQLQGDEARLLGEPQQLWVKTDAKGVDDAVLVPGADSAKEAFLLVVPSRKDQPTRSFAIDIQDGVPRLQQEGNRAPKLGNLAGHPGFKAGGQFTPEAIYLDASADRLALVQSTDVLVLNRRFDAAPEDFPFQEPEQGVGVDELNSFVSKFPIIGLTFSADGQRVATWHLNEYIQLWDEVNGRLQPSRVEGLFQVGNQPGKLLRGHSGDVVTACFADRSATQLLSVSRDGTVRNWDLTKHFDFVQDMERLKAEMEAQLVSDGSAAVQRFGRTRLPLMGYQFASTHPAAVPQQQESPGDDGTPAAPVTLSSSVLLEPVRVGEGDGRLRSWRRAFSAQFSTDGARVIVGADDLAAHVFDSQSGYPMMTMGGRAEPYFEPDRNNFLEGHVSEISSIRFLPPNGELLLTSDYFGSISVWDASVGEDGIGYERTRLLSEYSLSEFAISADGKWIAAGGAISVNGDNLPLEATTLRHQALIWNVDAIQDDVTAEPRFVLSGQHERFAITALAFSPDGTRLMTAGRRGKIVIWDIATETAIASLENAHNRDGVSGAFFESPNRLITAGFDGTVIRWELTDNSISRVPGANLVSGTFIERLRPSTDNRYFVVSDIRPVDPTVDDAAQTATAVLEVTCYAVPDESQPARVVHRFARIPIPEDDPDLVVRHDVSWSQDGKLLLFILDGKMTLYQTSDWSVVSRYELNIPLDPKRPDGPRLTAVRGALAPSAKDDAVCAATFDGRFAHLWNLTDRGSHVAEFRTHGPRTIASFSADGNYAATGSETIRVFEATGYDDVIDMKNRYGRTVLRLKTGEAHEHPVASVAFNPVVDADGVYELASADQTGQIKLWQFQRNAEGTAQAMELWMQPARDDREVDWARSLSFGNAVAWKPDGTQLASLQAGVASLWTLGPDKQPAVKVLPLPEGYECRFNQIQFARNKPWLVAGGLCYSVDDDTLQSFAAIWEIDEEGTPALIGNAFGEHSVGGGGGEDTITGVTSVTVDDDREVLVTGGVNGNLNEWPLLIPGDAETRLDRLGAITRTGASSAHNSRITALDIYNGRVLSADAEGGVLIWPAAAPQVIRD